MHMFLIKRILASALAIYVAGCRQQTVVSGSMAPTIAQGERVTVDFSAYLVREPERWDVVAFEPPNRPNELWIMRIVALPGESVTFDIGTITVNSKPLEHSPLTETIQYLTLEQLGRTSSIVSPYVVPPESFFVLGDSSGTANDSRFWGAVPRMNIRGKVKSK